MDFLTIVSIIIVIFALLLLILGVIFSNIYADGGSGAWGISGSSLFGIALMLLALFLVVMLYRQARVNTYNKTGKSQTSLPSF